MKLLLPFFVPLIAVSSLKAQMNTINDLAALHDRYKLAEITSRRFTHGQLTGWIQTLERRGQFDSKTLGSSAEGRTIRLYTVGNGKTKVLLWSQMHGDEPTATMALLDMLKFFSEAPDHPVSQVIRQNIALLMIPMINPDGAERFQRRTGQIIDMNRDALRLATPEARILKDARDRYGPEFGFNLHDQDPRYSVAQTKEVSAIALLAPALDEGKTDNAVRLRAKQLSAVIARALQELIPGHVTRYDDTFEPRAFGDNVQKWGTSTVLIESGGWPGDPEKMFLRKVNFVALLASFLSVAQNEYEKTDIALYENLPLNGKNRYDIIFRRAQFKASFSVPALVADIGITTEEKTDSASGHLFEMATIVDIGDLSTFGAFQDFDCSGLTFDSTEIAMDKELPKSELLDLLTRKKEQ
ncbi:MAG TPA: M14 family zinc carboxypeptidase [Bacteroidota bacterium]